MSIRLALASSAVAAVLLVGTAADQPADHSAPVSQTAKPETVTYPSTVPLSLIHI